MTEVKKKISEMKTGGRNKELLFDFAEDCLAGWKVPEISKSRAITLLQRLSKLTGAIKKEWDKRVHPKMAIEYLETYRLTCEYFYLAAKKFSKNTLELKDIGLFDLTRMKVIKSSEYLYPDVGFMANLMGRIKKTSGPDQCCGRPIPEDYWGSLGLIWV